MTPKSVFRKLFKSFFRRSKCVTAKTLDADADAQNEAHWKCSNCNPVSYTHLRAHETEADL
eukprot:3374858-Rhodomonas_salina.1